MKKENYKMVQLEHEKNGAFAEVVRSETMTGLIEGLKALDTTELIKEIFIYVGFENGEFLGDLCEDGCDHLLKWDTIDNLDYLDFDESDLQNL